MGNLYSRFNKEYKFVCIGFDGAGKTTLMYAFEKDCIIYGVPILGYDMEHSKFMYKGKKIYIRTWDVYENTKSLWRLEHKEEINGLVWVANACEEPERIPHVKQLLHRLLHEPHLQHVPLLIFANKQDLPNAASLDQLIKLLDLESITNRKWAIYATKGLESKEIVDSGFEWMLDVIDST